MTQQTTIAEAAQDVVRVQLIEHPEPPRLTCPSCGKESSSVNQLRKCEHCGLTPNASFNAKTGKYNRSLSVSDWAAHNLKAPRMVAGRCLCPECGRDLMTNVSGRKSCPTCHYEQRGTWDHSVQEDFKTYTHVVNVFDEYASRFARWVNTCKAIDRENTNRELRAAEQTIQRAAGASASINAGITPIETVYQHASEDQLDALRSVAEEHSKRLFLQSLAAYYRKDAVWDRQPRVPIKKGRGSFSSLLFGKDRGLQICLGEEEGVLMRGNQTHRTPFVPANSIDQTLSSDPVRYIKVPGTAYHSEDGYSAFHRNGFRGTPRRVYSNKRMSDLVTEMMSPLLDIRVKPGAYGVIYLENGKRDLGYIKSKDEEEKGLAFAYLLGYPNGEDDRFNKRDWINWETGEVRNFEWVEKKHWFACLLRNAFRSWLSSPWVEGKQFVHRNANFSPAEVFNDWMTKDLAYAETALSLELVRNITLFAQAKIKLLRESGFEVTKRSTVNTQELIDYLLNMCSDGPRAVAWLLKFSRKIWSKTKTDGFLTFGKIFQLHINIIHMALINHGENRMRDLSSFKCPRDAGQSPFGVNGTPRSMIAERKRYEQDSRKRSEDWERVMKGQPSSLVRIRRKNKKEFLVNTCKMPKQSNLTRKKIERIKERQQNNLTKLGGEMLVYQIGTCPKCGAGLNMGAKFCPACGTPLEVKQQFTCPWCKGELLSAKQEWCTNCGKNIPSYAQIQKQSTIPVQGTGPGKSPSEQEEFTGPSSRRMDGPGPVQSGPGHSPDNIRMVDDSTERNNAQDEIHDIRRGPVAPGGPGKDAIPVAVAHTGPIPVAKVVLPWKKLPFRELRRLIDRVHREYKDDFWNGLKGALRADDHRLIDLSKVELNLEDCVAEWGPIPKAQLSVPEDVERWEDIYKRKRAMRERLIDGSHEEFTMNWLELWLVHYRRELLKQQLIEEVQMSPEQKQFREKLVERLKKATSKPVPAGDVQEVSLRHYLINLMVYRTEDDTRLHGIEFNLMGWDALTTDSQRELWLIGVSYREGHMASRPIHGYMENLKTNVSMVTSELPVQDKMPNPDEWVQPALPADYEEQLAKAGLLVRAGRPPG